MYGVQIYNSDGTLFTREDRAQWRVVGTARLTIPSTGTSFTRTINMAAYDSLATHIAINPISSSGYPTLFGGFVARMLPATVSYSGSFATVTISFVQAQRMYYNTGVGLEVQILRRVN